MAVALKTKSITRKNFTYNCLLLAKRIEKNKKTLIELLSSYETYSTIDDEIERSIDALKGVRTEMNAIKKPLKNLNVSTFFPLNLPLYSLVLFGIAPSAYASNVFIRPPEVMNGTLRDIIELLGVSSLFPNISLKPSPRHIFIKLYASGSDVIIFTGKYENAMQIHSQCPNSLLVYNGSGINPFIITGDADVSLAVAKSVEMRCFNSGQDCAGPDAFFVHSSVSKSYQQKLMASLKKIKVSNPVKPDTDIGPTMKQNYLDDLMSWLNRHTKSIVYGGEVDSKKHVVHPGIILKKLDQLEDEEFHEFFAPIFYVIEYSDRKSLLEFLNSSRIKEKSMYISVFGDASSFKKHIDFAKILENKIVNDVERGNQEYGGYGARSNFLLYKGKKLVKPVLISRDIHQVLS